MKRKILLTLILCLLTTSLAFANERRLLGQVLVLGEHNERVPAKRNTEVVIIQIDTSEYTDANGVFDYYLREKDKANKEISFLVKLEGYIVQDPLDGQTRIPKDSELDNLIRLLLVKKGSPYILSAARFDKSVEEANVKAKDQVKLGKDEQRVPIELKVGEVAAKLGFSEEVFRRWILEKAAEQEKSPNPKARARAAAAKGDFNKAGDLQMQATEQLAETYARARPKKQRGPWLRIDQAIPRLVKDSSPRAAEDLEQLALELVKGFRFAGDAYYNAYEFDKALAAYKRALQYVSKEDSPELWAAIQVDIGRAHAEIGNQTEGAAIHQNFEKAIGVFQAALTIYTREVLPQDWAKTNYRLCKVLFDQGRRANGEPSTQLLAKAVEACNDALTIYTKEKFPLQWANTKGLLARVLLQQLPGLSNEAWRQLFEKAMASYRETQTFYTNELTPELLLDAIPHDLIGQYRSGGDIGVHLIAEAVVAWLTAIFNSVDGELALPLFDKAVAAWQNTLTVYTKEQFPIEWAGIQSMMGWTLQFNAEKNNAEETRPQLITQAADAYQKALTVFTAEKYPDKFATIQFMMGIMLKEQGDRTEGKDGMRLLAQAVSAYHSALKLEPRALPPQAWAVAQHLLGDALVAQGTRAAGEAGTSLFTQAVEAYEAALQVHTHKHLPKLWGGTHQQLAKAYLALENWQGVAESNSNVLIVDPDDKKAYDSAFEAYHDKLFAYASAFDLAKQWLNSHPDDISSQAKFAVTNLTTGRFDDAEQRWTELLKRPDLSPEQTFAVRFLAIVTLSALRRDSDIPQSLQNLRQIVSSQPDDFHLVVAPTAGIIQYVKTAQVFAPHRAWLIELLSLADAKDRNSLLAVLESAESHFMPIETR